MSINVLEAQKLDLDYREHLEEGGVVVSLPGRIVWLDEPHGKPHRSSGKPAVLVVDQRGRVTSSYPANAGVLYSSKIQDYFDKGLVNEIFLHGMGDSPYGRYLGDEHMTRYVNDTDAIIASGQTHVVLQQHYPYHSMSHPLPSVFRPGVVPDVDGVPREYLSASVGVHTTVEYFFDIFGGGYRVASHTYFYRYAPQLGTLVYSDADETAIRAQGYGVELYPIVALEAKDTDNKVVTSVSLPYAEGYGALAMHPEVFISVRPPMYYRPLTVLPAYYPDYLEVE